MFETRLEKILEKVEQIEPVKYGKTRNFLDGAVTRLSPYISRGVISTKYIFEKTLTKKHKFFEIEKFLMELAWRDYFQNVWLNNDPDRDLRQPQPDVQNSSVPKAILEAKTGIEAVDKAISDLYETGYVHNHLRMYIASITCNVAKSDWKIPAKWFYYHLFDADWASNSFSWQWTCAAFSSKKYYANQENINKYCGTNQRGTFLDVEYAEFPELEIPEVLRETETPVLRTQLPKNQNIEIDNSLPTLIYNFYNLDPFWKSDIKANRVLLLEPSHFEKYPVSAKTFSFVLKLAVNIERIQIFKGEFDDLKKDYNLLEIYFKEHPTAGHYEGIKEERDWMFPEIRGYFPSFFGYWKKCEKVIKCRL
jgi:deoxyribodipyrimidine photo-lyase